jgi:dihydrofolate synthase/folylpolyglutamate synthase
MALGATQFEALTAAALLAFAEAGVDVAAVEAGLGGRHDATNVLQTRVVVLTNVGLDHTEVLGSTREAIAREKLAVVQPESVAVLGEAEWEPIARRNGAARVVVEARGNSSLGGAAASAFLGRGVRPAEVELPGRLEFRPDEIRDGAHTPEAVRFIAPQLPPIGAALASILSDKDVDGILRELRGLTPVIVATRSSHPRALPADALANRARPYFEKVESADDPVQGLGRAHALGSPVLVTGSLYLLADLLRREEEPRRCRNLVNG